MPSFESLLKRERECGYDGAVGHVGCGRAVVCWMLDAGEL